ncbi:MAG: metallophosphoesterase [Anaerolineales bacterium]|nr:metallophosphoesterase [Anaerolineales bacterium]
MRVLALSDQVLDFVYTPAVAQRFGAVDLVIGCGDLPYYYLEFLVDTLGKPVFFVRGNHAPNVEYSQTEAREAPWGAIDLHRKLVHHNGLILAGFEGSLRYRRGPFMYTQSEMWLMVLGMLPRLLYNRLRYGRALDVLVTHAPAWDVSDRQDTAHRGFKAFRWLLRTFKPKYHLHGHIHLYDRNEPAIIQFERTQVVNAYGYQELELTP